MPTAVLDVTTDNIRAALGLTSKELADQMILDARVQDQLIIRIAFIYPGYAALKAAITPGPGTAAQQQLWLIMQLYEMYQGAMFLLPQCQNIFAQTMMDGETTMARFQNDNLKDTIDRLQGQSDMYAGLLNSAYNASLGLGFKIVNSVAPIYNPVTGFPNIFGLPAILADLTYLGVYNPVFV